MIHLSFFTHNVRCPLTHLPIASLKVAEEAAVITSSACWQNGKMARGVYGDPEILSRHTETECQATRKVPKMSQNT